MSSPTVNAPVRLPPAVNFADPPPVTVSAAFGASAAMLNAALRTTSYPAVSTVAPPDFTDTFRPGFSINPLESTPFTLSVPPSMTSEDDAPSALLMYWAETVPPLRWNTPVELAPIPIPSSVRTVSDPPFIVNVPEAPVLAPSRR